MRTRRGFMTTCWIIAEFIKFLHGKPLCSNDLYQRRVPETGDIFCCREVSVKPGYAAIPCMEDGTEDHVQECPNGTHQPDNTSSRHTPHCIPDPKCTDKGIRKDLKYIGEYSWPVCICSLEDGKCGLNRFECHDIEKFKCPLNVLQDCSCAPLVITTTLPTSLPTTNSSNTTDLTTHSSVPTLTRKPWTGSTKIVNITEDETDKGNKWIIPTAIFAGCIFLALSVVLLVLCIRSVHCSQNNNNRPKEAEEQALIPVNGQEIEMQEFNIHIVNSPEHAGRVTRQPTPPQPGSRFTGSFPEPALPRLQPDHSESINTSEVNNPTGSDSSHESNTEPETGADDPDGSDFSQGTIADHRSEEADLNGVNMSHESTTECGTEPPSYPSIPCAEISLQRVPMARVAPIMRQVQNNRSSIEEATEPLSSIAHTLMSACLDALNLKYSSQGHYKSLPAIMRQVQNNQSSTMRQVQNNQSMFGSLGPSLSPDSLLTENSIGEEETSNTQPSEAIRESQSGDSTPQTEANMLGQLQLCTKAAVNHNSGEQSETVQAYDPDNTDLKVISQNESSETITEAVDSENTLLKKVTTEKDFSSDFGQMTGAARNYANNNVMNKPEESLARRNPINCSTILAEDFQAQLNKEPSQKMNSVYHTQGQFEQVLAGQNNGTQNLCSNINASSNESLNNSTHKLCSDVNASSNERLEVIKDGTSHELDTSLYSDPGVNLHLSSFMSGDSILHTESNNAQSRFPSSTTQPEETEGSNFDGKSLHGRLGNPTLDGLKMCTVNRENQWLTSRHCHSLHSLQSLVQEQSVLQKLPQMLRRSLSCPVLHPKFS